MKKYKYLLLLCLIVSFASCRTSKNIVSNGSSVLHKTKDQLFSDILDADLQYKTISGKVSLEMVKGENPSGIKVNSHLKIIKDEALQLSIRAPFINTEVFRITLTKDSVFIIDRMNKLYAAENFENLRKEKDIPFNYNNLQSLFTESLFFPGKNVVKKRDVNGYDVRLNNNRHEVKIKDRFGLQYTFQIDSNDKVTQTDIRSVKNDNYSSLWLYDDFIKDNDKLYPTKMKFNIKIKKRRGGLIMTYPKLDFDKQLEIDRSLPNKYQKVSFISIFQNYIK